MINVKIIESKQDIDISKLQVLHMGSTVGIRDKEGLETAQMVLRELLKGEENNYVHLTSTWEAESFYQKAGFKRHKTDYAKYPKSSEYLAEDC